MRARHNCYGLLKKKEVRVCVARASTFKMAGCSFVTRNEWWGRPDLNRRPLPGNSA
jgi:hypothetical protein